MTAADVISVAVIATFGAIAGSFVNVLIDRLPVLRREPDEFGSMYESRPWPEVLGGRSRCSECGVPLEARDLIPIASWVVLRGRCRSCDASFGVFHPLVELLVPALLVAAWVVDGWSWAFAVVAAFVLMAVPLAMIDLRTLTLPKALVWPATFFLAGVTVVAAVVSTDVDLLIKALIGSATVTVPLFVLWFIHPTGQGFGDVRLAVSVGWVVGATSRGESLLNASFRGWICLLVAATVGLVMSIPFAMAQGLRVKVPFGPFLVVGALVCALGAARIGV